MKKSTTVSTILAMIVVIAVPTESKAITIDDISSIVNSFTSPQNSSISPILVNNAMTSFGVGGSTNRLTLSSPLNGGQPLSISNLMDFTSLSQLDKIGLPKTSDGLAAGNTDSLLNALTAQYSAVTASASKNQVDASAKNVAETTSSISAVINTEEIDPGSSLEMLRKMGKELQANGQMLQSTAAVQVAQAKIDANRYNLEAANVQQQNFKDFQEKRYIDNAAFAKARLQEMLLKGSFGDETTPAAATPTITATSPLFGP
jgi:hypothetical protein